MYPLVQPDWVVLAKHHRREAEILGECVARWREAAGLSRHEISLKLGHTRNYFGRVEKAQQSFTVIDFLDVAEAVGRPADDLFREFTSELQSRIQ